MPDRPTPDTPHTSIEPAEELWRCPAHGVLEPHKLSRGWGTGEPGEYGTCPVMLDEDTGCGEVLERPPIALAEQDLPALSLGADQVAKLEKIIARVDRHGQVVSVTCLSGSVSTSETDARFDAEGDPDGDLYEPSDLSGDGEAGLREAQADRPADKLRTLKDEVLGQEKP
jgi:hypothetical protein